MRKEQADIDLKLTDRYVKQKDKRQVENQVIHLKPYSCIELYALDY